MAKEQTTEKIKKIKIAPYIGLGRRKRSVARVWLWEKKGEVTVNGIPIKEYFPKEKHAIYWQKPFHTVGISHPLARFSGTIKIEGGGFMSQLGAVRLGVARALLKYDKEFRQKLRRQGLLTRDPREKERKKPFLRKARKRPQFSKR